MRWLLALFLLIGTTDGIRARQVTRYVQDDQGKPIPYVSIGVVNKNSGTYTFEDGSYQLATKGIRSADVIQFSCIGFEPRAITFGQLPDTVILQPTTYVLPTHVVRTGQTSTYGIVKKNSASDISISRPYQGAEVAVLIDLSTDSLWIEAIYLNIKAENVPEYMLRARFYAFEGEGQPPGRAFESFETRATFNTRTGTITFEPDSHLLLTGPVFVSFEWLVTNRTAEQIKAATRQEPKTVTALRKAYPGYSVNVYNQKRVEVENSKGEVIKTSKLTSAERTQLKQLKDRLPKLKFQTTKAQAPTYYRSHSLGKWYLYQQSLIASITVH
jgi:hypothetical protein